MVSQDGQLGLKDTVISDPEVQAAVKEWHKATVAAVGASALLKAKDDAREKVRGLLPAFEDGESHRFVFIDETQDPPVQYVVPTQPGPEAKAIEFTRESRARLQVEQKDVRPD